MKYLKTLDSHIEKVREELVLTDSKEFNANVKGFFNKSILPAKEMLFIITMATRIHIEVIQDRLNRVEDGGKAYTAIGRYIDTYLDGINVESFKVTMANHHQVLGFTLAVYIDNDKSTIYKLSSKQNVNNIEQLTVKQVLDLLMSYDEENNNE